MDEEQKSNIDPIAEISQRPKQKINVDSFFNRSADAESITAISLKLASVIEQIDVMKTEIKEIATYITVEHKIEKDLREDRLFEEQDAKQKKEMKDRLAKGEQVPKTAKGETPQEESKGGGFFSGLLKLVGGLGLIAGVGALITAALPVITPILLGALAVGLTGLVIAKIAPPIVNFVKDLGPKIGNVFGGLLENTLGKVPLIGKSVINFAGKISGKLGEITGGISDSLKTNFGNIAGGTKDSNLNLKENNAGNDMANTLENKGVIKDTRNFGDNYKEQEEYFASDEYKQSFDNEVEEVDDGDKKKIYLVRGFSGVKFDTRDEAVRYILNYIETKAKPRYDKAAAHPRGIDIDEKSRYENWIKRLDDYVTLIKNDKQSITEDEIKRIDKIYKDFQMSTRIEVEGKSKLESGAIIDASGSTAPENLKGVEVDSSGQYIFDEKLYDTSGYEGYDPNLSMNNTSVVVPKNEPQVSSAEIKVTGTTLAYARALQNPYLSITNKKIPPELSRIG